MASKNVECLWYDGSALEAAIRGTQANATPQNWRSEKGRNGAGMKSPDWAGAKCRGL